MTLLLHLLAMVLEEVDIQAIMEVVVVVAMVICNVKFVSNLDILSLIVIT